MGANGSVYRARRWPRVVLALLCALIFGALLAATIMWLPLQSSSGPGTSAIASILTVSLVTAMAGLAVIAMSLPLWWVLWRLRWTGWVSAALLGTAATAVVHTYLLGTSDSLDSFQQLGPWLTFLAGGLSGLLTFWLAHRRVASEAR